MKFEPYRKAPRRQPGEFQKIHRTRRTEIGKAQCAQNAARHRNAVEERPPCAVKVRERFRALLSITFTRNTGPRTATEITLW